MQVFEKYLLIIFLSDKSDAGSAAGGVQRLYVQGKSWQLVWTAAHRQKVGLCQG